MLYINADDYGINKFSDELINKAISKKLINSISISANGKNIMSSLKIIRNTPVKKGIHLTLTNLFPLSNNLKITTLLDESKKLHDLKIFLMNYLKGKISLTEIAIEMEKQIIFLLKQNIIITHCDSHKHIHLLPSISNIVIKLCIKYNIPYIRIIKDSLNIRYYKRLLPLIVLKTLSCLLQLKILFSKKLKVKKSFGFNTHVNLDTYTFDKAYKKSKQHEIELFCHPQQKNNEYELLYSKKKRINKGS